MKMDVILAERRGEAKALHIKGPGSCSCMTLDSLWGTIRFSSESLEFVLSSHRQEPTAWMLPHIQTTLRCHIRRNFNFSPQKNQIGSLCYWQCNCHLGSSRSCSCQIPWHTKVTGHQQLPPSLSFSVLQHSTFSFGSLSAVVLIWHLSQNSRNHFVVHHIWLSVWQMFCRHQILWSRCSVNLRTRHLLQ